MLRGPGYVGASGQRKIGLLASSALSALSSFSRSSPATYQDTALLRNAPHNLFTFSSAFDNAIWTVASATLTPVAAAGPTGNAVYKIAETATNATHGFTGPAMPIVAGQSYTISIHYQAAERGFARISCSNGSGQSDVWFNLATGVVGTIFLGGAVARAAIAAVGDWYRCTLSFVATATTSVAAVFRAQQIDAETGYQGVAGSGIYASAAQWEQNPDASTYTHTTTAPVYGPRFNRNTLIAQNLIANPRGEYTATPAFPTSAPPNGWSNGGASNGVTVQYAGSGTNDPATGLPYTDVQWIGTSSATGFVSVWPMDLAGTPAVDGQTWTASLGVQLIAGGAASGFLSAEARGTGGAGGLQSTQQNFTATSAVQRLGIPITLATSGVVKSAATLLRVAVTNGVAINCTLRLTGWQLELGALVSPVSLPPVGQIGPSVLYAGALAGRNLIRNPRAEQALPGLIGSGGALPYGWSTFATSGLNTQIVATGTGPDGNPTIDLRVFGTTTNTFYVLAFENTANPAAPGQVWTESVSLGLVAGSLAGVTTNIDIRQTVGGTFDVVAPAIPAAPQLTRYAATATLNGSATGVHPALFLNFANGAVLDFTIRISTPQLEPRGSAGQLSLPPVGQPGTSYIETGARLQIEESRQSSVVNPRFEGATFHTGTPAILQPIETGGVITGFTILQAGDGYTVAPAISVGGTPGTGFAGTTTISGGAVTGVTITNGGTGYVNPGAIVRGGTLPTSYFWGNSTGSAGVYAGQSSVGVDTRNGIPRFKVRYAAQGAGSTFELGWNNALAATQGQVASQSTFVEVVAGSLAGISGFGHSLYESPSSASLGSSHLAALTAAPNTFQRVLNQNRTVAQATTTAVAGRWSLGGSGTYDVTLGYGCPQLELGAFCTSPILPPPGSPAATTRANDLATVNLGSWFKTAGTVTNLSLWSEQADQWSSNGAPNDCSVTANASLAPDGSSNADLIIPSNTSGSHIRYATFIGAINTTYCYSEFFKPGGYNFVRIGLANSAFGANTRYAIFDLSAGIIVSQDAGANASISAVGTFYRCAVSATSLGTGGAYVTSIEPIPTGTYAAFAGDGVSGVLAWGAMVNTGTTPGPYIPTTTTAVTKTATGPGTIIFKAAMPPPVPGTTTGWSLSDGTTGNSIWIYNPTISSGMNGRTLHGGIVGSDWGLTITPIPAGSTVKVALAWDPVAGTMRGCVNGGTVFSATVPIPAGLTTFAEGSIATSRFWNNDIESVDYYPASLSNAQLQALTV